MARGDLPKSVWQQCIGVVCILILFAVVAMVGCSRDNSPQKDRVVIQYWEKWGGFEREAMKVVVDDFNASQDRIFVDFLQISQIDRKLMLATAGGNPPDVAGIWSWATSVYAENNALMPLDKMVAEAGIQRSDYIDIFWRLCTHRGHLWGLPSCPASIALHWNKKLFREAGLDPERPPHTLAEFEQFNEKLTRRNPDGTIAVLGHHPEEPGWWSACWGYWFGGAMWDGEGRITANSPGNLAALEWMQTYPKRFGVSALLSFKDGSGNFASPQNPFFTGRMAMVLQGVWLRNFIEKYAPKDFEWGVAPFPSIDPVTRKDVTISECDLLVIPAGAKHPREAFEFIHYVNTPKPMEKLCLGQRKFSPFRLCSPDFIRNHPNPNIEKFIALAKSPNVMSPPALTTWTEYRKDMVNAVGRVMTLKATPAEALAEVQERQQRIFDRKNARWKRVEAQRMAEWGGQ